MCLKYLTTMILARERSEEEKLRRHLHGDKGAKFKAGKVPKLAPPRICPAITTLVTKDIPLLEIYESDDDTGRG